MSLEPPLMRKVGSQNFGTIRPIDGYEKSPSFMALAQMFFGTDQKNHMGADPPTTSNRFKPKSYLKLIKKYIFFEGEQFPLIARLKSTWTLQSPDFGTV